MPHPECVFDDTYAAPWQSLIFPNFKDCIKTGFKKPAPCQERKNTLWTEIMVQFGREGTRRVRTTGLAGRMDLYLMQTADYCHPGDSAQPSCLHGERDGQTAPPHPHHLPFLETNWGSSCLKCGKNRAVVTGHDVTGATCRGGEGISEQGKRSSGRGAKDGEHTAEINWRAWKPPQVWWFHMTNIHYLPQPCLKVSVKACDPLFRG